MIRIAKDKWRHFFVAIPLGAVLLLISRYFFSEHLAITIAFAALFIICYAFELFSKITGKGHYEVMDIVAGVIGGVLGIFFLYLAT